MCYPIIHVKISTNSREQVDLCDKSSFSVYYLDKVFYKVEYLRPEKILWSYSFAEAERNNKIMSGDKSQ